VDVDDGRVAVAGDGRELLVGQDLRGGDEGPRPPDLPRGTAQLLKGRDEARDAAILDDPAAGPGREAVEQVVTPEVAAPAPTVALAEDQPGLRHEAARYGAMSSWIAGYA
jgi:hypothetical protein